MNTFAEELKELIEKWEGFGKARDDIVDELINALDRLAPDAD